MSRRYTTRLDGFDYIGSYRYSLTFCTHKREPHFTNPAIVSAIRLQFLQTAERHGFAVSAYCFMPDHVHLLVEGLSGESRALPFISAAKQQSGYWFKERYGTALWQRSSWDHVVRSNEQTMAVIRYLLMNPVRAGLAAAPLDYPFSGSQVYSREELLDAFERPAG